MNLVMLKKISSVPSKLCFLVLIYFVLSATFVLAQNNPPPESGSPNFSNEGRNNPSSTNDPNFSNEGRNNPPPVSNSNYSNEGRNNPPPGSGAPLGGTTLKNPVKIDSIEDLLVAILNILIIIAIPIIVFFIIYSGFLYVTARGNAPQIEQATRSLTYAVIGGVLIIGAVAIAEIVKNLVQSF